MLDQLASDIAGRPIPGFRWSEPIADNELLQVPVRWWGRRDLAGHLIRPRSAPIGVREFESYLRHHQIAIETGGEHPYFRVGA